MRKLIYLLVLSVLVSGCASVQITRTGKEAFTKKLNSEDPVYIITPENGVYENKEYTGSGKMTANFLVLAFSRYSKQVEKSEGVEVLEVGLAKAKDKGFMYLVSPQILKWEDRATEWSGITDKVQVKVSLVDLSTGDIIDTVLIKGHSAWATFGGDHPQDLLEKPINEYVASLY